MNTIKRLVTFMHGYWKDTIFTWVSVALEARLEILVAFFLQYLLAGVQNNSASEIGRWTGIIAGMAICAAVAGIFAGYWASSAAAGFGKNLREGRYEKVQTYSFKNIDKFSTSSIVTRRTTDRANIQFSFMMILRMVIRAPLRRIFARIRSFVTAPSLAWVFLIVIPVLLLVLIVIANSAHKLFVKIFDTYDDLNQDVQEDVDGVRVIKSFDRKEYHTSKFKKISAGIYSNYIKAEYRLAFNGPVRNLAVYGTRRFISYFGAKKIVESGNTSLQITQLTTLFTYIRMILRSLRMVSQIYVRIIISRNSAERCVEILNEQSDIVSPSNPIREVENGQVEFKNVSFSYGKGKDVLENVNLSFASGETVGIIGPTGSSKTTLISLIARLYDATEGEVLVAGHNVKEYDVAKLRDAVAVVLQKNTLFTGTIRENLKWGNENATDEEIWKACDLAQASEFLKRFPKGLDTMLVEGGNNVSGGQKQRLCIARALLKNPKILILDDSTSACDTHTDSLIREGLSKERNDVTKFIIAQRVLSIRDCQTIIVRDAGGKIVAQGNNDGLRQNCPVYKELYESQLGGGDFDVKAD